jgi:hypothetical protein
MGPRRANRTRIQTTTVRRTRDTFFDITSLHVILALDDRAVVTRPLVSAPIILLVSIFHPWLFDTVRSARRNGLSVANESIVGHRSSLCPALHGASTFQNPIDLRHRPL